MATTAIRASSPEMPLAPNKEVVRVGFAPTLTVEVAELVTPSESDTTTFTELFPTTVGRQTMVAELELAHPAGRPVQL